MLRLIQKNLSEPTRQQWFIFTYSLEKRSVTLSHPSFSGLLRLMCVSMTLSPCTPRSQEKNRAKWRGSEYHLLSTYYVPDPCVRGFIYSIRAKPHSALVNRCYYWSRLTNEKTETRFIEVTEYTFNVYWSGIWTGQIWDPKWALKSAIFIKLWDNPLCKAPISLSFRNILNQVFVAGQQYFKLKRCLVITAQPSASWKGCTYTMRGHAGIMNLQDLPILTYRNGFNLLF